MKRLALPLSEKKKPSLKKLWRLPKARLKSPFSKGGFRGIIKNFIIIPPSPPLKKGGELTSQKTNNILRLPFHFLSKIFFVICVLLISGCILAPKYERDPEVVPQEYRFQSPAGQPRPELQTLADLSWWELFQDPVLQELIRSALVANYDLRLAAARVAEARAQVGVSRSAWLPQVGGTALYRRERLTESGHPPAGPGFKATENVAQFNFDLFWEIDLFGRLRSLTKAAQAEFFASEWARRAVLSAVVAEVARAYFELRTLDQQLEISRRTLKSYQDSLRLVTLRFERGVVSKQDVYQVQALLHTAGARIPDLQRLIGQQENRISILLGRNPEAIPRGKPLPELSVRAAIPAGLPSALLERRPDIRQSEEVLIATNYRIGAARANFFPNISLSGLLGTQSADLARLFTGPAKIWTIGPTALQPIFTSGRNIFTLKTAKAQQEQALTLYQFTVRTAFREVSDGLIAHTKFREFRQQQELLVQSYQGYSRLANLRYKGGIASYLAVLDADRQLFDAELQLAGVQRDQLLTVVQLYQALGGGWENEGKYPGPAQPVYGLNKAAGQ
jgi:multidrug efflux system outer membrane protein